MLWLLKLGAIDLLALRIWSCKPLGLPIKPLGLGYSKAQNF
jgi:hypothetical protein